MLGWGGGERGRGTGLLVTEKRGGERGGLLRLLGQLAGASAGAAHSGKGGRAGRSGPAGRKREAGLGPNKRKR